MDRTFWASKGEDFDKLNAEDIVQNQDRERLVAVCAAAGRMVFQMIDSGMLDSYPFGIEVHSSFRVNPVPDQSPFPGDEIDPLFRVENWAIYWVCFRFSQQCVGGLEIRNASLWNWSKPLRRSEDGTYVPNWAAVSTDPERFASTYFYLEQEYMQSVVDESRRLCDRLGDVCEPSGSSSQSSEPRTARTGGPPELAPTVPLVPEGASWDNIRMEVIDDDAIKYNAGEGWVRVHYAELGFIDRRRALPNKLWPIFRSLADRRMAPPASGPWINRKDIQRIRNTLRAYFGLQDNPIDYNRNETRYECRFSFTDDRDW